MSGLNNSIEEDMECIYPLNLSDNKNVRYFIFVYFAFADILVITSLVLWRKHMHLVYLQKRHFSQILVFSLGWIALLFNLAVPLLALEFREGFALCTVMLFAEAVITPWLLIPLIVRLMLFRARVRLNNYASGLSVEEFSTDKQYERLRFFASVKFGTLFLSLGFVVTFVFALSFALTMCPNLRIEQPACVVAREEEDVDGIVMLLNAFYGSDIVLSFLIVAVGVAIYLKVRHYPDPFKIIHEIKKLFIYMVLLLILSVPLRFIFLSNDNFQTPYSKFYTSMLFFVPLLYIYVVPYQIYLAKQFRETEATDAFGLSTVLDEKIGRQLFRQHLVSEFSIENLLFYDAVNEFKEDKAVSRQVRAKKIFTIFLQSTAEFQINIPSRVLQNIEDKLNRDEEIAVDLFDEAQDEAYRLMQNDSFARFRRTNVYEEYIGSRDIVVGNESEEKNLF